MNHLEHAEPLLAGDAYDELAKVNYADLATIKASLPREKLLRWIGDVEVGTSRRRLYLQMLSLCATAEDVERFEGYIFSREERMRKSLDAAIFGYLAIKGSTGMPLVEQLFLADADAEYTDTYSAIMAVRQIAADTNAVPKRRLAEGLRHVLGRPKIADLVGGDLARMQDWSAMPELVGLFRTADPKENWIRVPVLLYLRECPLPQAKAQLHVLSKLDPDAATKAKSFAQQKDETPNGA
jgi:hypothetical protein